MKRTKSFFMLLTGLAISTCISAQLPISMGVKAGMNLSEIQKMDDNVKVGFNVGVTVELELSNDFFLMSGLELTTKGAKNKSIILIGDNTSTESSLNKATMNAIYLQLPVHAGYKWDIAPDTKLVLRAGPYFAYGIGGKIKWNNKNINFFDDSTNRFDFGIGGAVGVEFGKINAFIGADQGLAKIFKGSKMKNRCAHISVGYKF